MEVLAHPEGDTGPGGAGDRPEGMTTEAFRFQRSWTGQGVSWEGRKLRPLLLRGGTLGSLSPTPPRCSLSRVRIFLKELKSPPVLPPTPLTPHSTLEATGIITGCSSSSKHRLPSPLLGPHMPTQDGSQPPSEVLPGLLSFLSASF